MLRAQDVHPTQSKLIKFLLDSKLKIEKKMAINVRSSSFSLLPHKFWQNNMRKRYNVLI
jgi:hypothetical protein